MTYWMQTYTGKKVTVPLNPSDPLEIDVDLEDIARGMANQPRFNGQTSQFFSLAEHSCILSIEVDKEIATQAFFYDAAKAYIGNLIYPIKVQMFDYMHLEYRIRLEIFNQLGVPPLTADSEDVIKFRDKQLLRYEAKRLLGGRRLIDDWPQSKVEDFQYHPPYDYLNPNDAFHRYMERAVLLRESK